MKPSASQKSRKKSSAAPPALRSKLHGKRKLHLSIRNPLQLHNLNAISTTPSIEAPKGCVSLSLSHSSSSSSSSQAPASRSKILHKTPKSAPHVRPSKPSKLKPSKENIPKILLKENTESHKFQKSINLKKPGALSGILACKVSSNSCGNSLTFTPLSKIAGWSGVDFVIDSVVEENSKAGDLKTPPIQVSVSPEIECGSSMAFSATPVCYGAGYAVSGVTDKRKCKPRGILTVRENVAGITNFDDEVDEEIKGVMSYNGVSLIPSPMEASVNWILPACKEETEDQKATHGYPTRQSQIDNGSIARQSRSSSLSGNGVSSESFNFNNFQTVNFEAESCRFSMSSFGSGNVIQTPQSDDKNQQSQFHSEQDEFLPMESLSPVQRQSITDQSEASFKFDCRSTMYSSCDLNQTYWPKLPQPGTRMDEFDEITNGFNNGSSPPLGNPARTEIANNEENSGKRMSCACAESISTDGGLILSGDSDSNWNLCHNNHLFDV